MRVMNGLLNFTTEETKLFFSAKKGYGHFSVFLVSSVVNPCFMHRNVWYWI